MQLAQRNEAQHLADLFANGGIALYPTDTVWGLGCDALNAEAVSRIYAAKSRNERKSLIILVNDLAMLQTYVPEMSGKVLRLHEYHTRPLTIIYAKSLLPAHLLADDGSVAVRVVGDPFCQAVITALGRPIVSTSANISGAPTPRFFNEISPEMLQNVDYKCRYRQEDRTETAPSTIIRLNEQDDIILIRP